MTPITDSCAVDVGAAPGTVVRMTGEELHSLLGSASVHDLGISDLLVELRVSPRSFCWVRSRRIRSGVPNYLMRWPRRWIPRLKWRSKNRAGAARIRKRKAEQDIEAQLAALEARLRREQRDADVTYGGIPAQSQSMAEDISSALAGD